jgi:polyisoprenyl-teichoic acid--peptidoglycan teichoic acid transferase
MQDQVRQAGPPPRGSSPLSRAELRNPPRTYYRRVALGTVLPGAGLLGTRWRVLGAVLVGVAVALGLFVVVQLARGGVVRSVLDVAVRPEVLQWLGVALMVGAVLWVGSIILTAQLTWPGPRGRAGLQVAFAVVACLLVVAPSALAVRYLGVQGSLIDEVFAQDGDGGSRDPALANAGADDPWADVDRVNLLLIGSDAAKGREGTRTDSLMVVSINTETGDTLLVGVPRNLERVPIPDDNPLSSLWPNGYDCGDECLMNGIWTLAESRPDLFPGVENPGRQSTVDVVGAVTGLEIDHSVVINLHGFLALVDAMGGVEVNVRERVCVDCSQRANGSIRWTKGTEEWIEPGLQRLDGRHALWYSRSRAGSDDFSRMRRQRCVAGALIEQADPVSLLSRYPQIASVVKDNVNVDIPSSQLPAWVDLVLRIQEGNSIRSLPLTSNVVSPARPDFDEIHALVQRSLTPKAPTATPAPTTSTEAPTTLPTSSPSPSATPDDADAEQLSATC